MTAGRPKKEPKWPVRLDGEIRAWVRELMEKHPGTWASERAALHELVRIGRLTFTGPVPPPAEPPLDVQTREDPGDVEDQGEAPVESSLGRRGAEDVGRARAPARVSWQEPEEAPSSFGWRAPAVRCERCGEDVETTAAAREAHFKTCPPEDAERVQSQEVGG